MVGTVERDWKAWGHLAKRYREVRPRRMLSLDGGGIRGILTLEVLDRIEELLRKRYNAGPAFRLSQYFDYIGGTSTGAIIAAALARGLSVAEVREFYTDFGREVFRKRPLLERLRSLYDHGPLEQKLREVYDPLSTLEPQHLKTLLLVVTRNATTDSAWPVSSNPDAKYNNLLRKDCNLKIPVWKLVRASTAAPIYFNPEVIEWDPLDPAKAFVFVDGGTTSYNSPAFLMVRMATEPAYQLGWARGEDQLLVVSLGTGSAAVLGNAVDNPTSLLPSNVLQTFQAVMYQSQVDQDYSCRTIGRCTYGGRLDSEVEDLVPREGPLHEPIPLSRSLGRAFLYARYDADLSQKGLHGLGLNEMESEQVQKLDAVASMDDLVTIGRKVAEKVDLAHFGSFADPSRAPLAEG